MIPRIYSPHVYSIFRAVTGFMFIFHGLQKIFGMYAGNVGEFGTQRWLAGVLELGLGGLVMIGLFTTVAAFVASGEMAVAYFQSHLPRGALPIENGGELAALYCFAFLFIASYGAGPWSIDALRGGKKT
jgi:putative oxidoreductase